MQNRDYIFTFLSIDVPDSFLTMDLFRLFDRSGRGTINIEDFVMGIVEKLRLLKKDSGVLGDIAEELLTIDTRPGELANKLEKATPSLERLSSFRVNFKALSYALRSHLTSIGKKSSEQQPAITILTKPILIR